jgi:arylsulfatase A-like enzyme
MSGSEQRPNVLVVLTDQQRWDTVGAHGSPLDMTPHLDAAADDGTVLEQMVTPQPVCTPARACLQTGRYATTTGVIDNGWQLPELDDTLARVFDRAGYETGYIGKWHLNDGPYGPVPAADRAGYEDYWRAANALEWTSHPYEGVVYDADDEPVEIEGYRVDGLTEMAREFIQTERDSPFFLCLSYLEPHHQNDMHAHPAPEGYAYKHRNAWVPPDLRDQPGDWQSELPGYYGICERLDECYGRLLDVLEATGELETTIVLYTSDHGSHFRTRNSEYKRSCHESSIHVPAIVRGPGFEGGNRIDEITSLVDVPPTLIDATGLAVPDAMEGDSMLPLVAGDETAWQNEAFIQPISGEKVARAIRTDRWTYAARSPEPGGTGDTAPGQSEVYVDSYLYDLRADPHQQQNLVGKPEYADVAADLRERLTERIGAIEQPVEIKPASL